MTLLTLCCCGGCQNPTGTTIISATRHIEAQLPVAPFSGSHYAEWYIDFDLQFSGTSLDTASSSIRVRYDEDVATTYPDGTPASTYQRKIDITMTPAGGTMQCNSYGSLVCDECGGTTVHRYDPEITLPYKVGANQVGGLTLNSYVATSSNINWLGVALQSSLSTFGTASGTSGVCGFAHPSRYWAWNGSDWLQPSSAPKITPLRVWSPLSSGNPDSICPPYDMVLGTWEASLPFITRGSRGATRYGSNNAFPAQCVLNLCPAGKQALQQAGWTFTTDTATASIT